MSFKKVLLPMALLSAAGFSGISLAHSTVGESISGTNAMDVDVLHTNCFSYTAATLPVPNPDGFVTGAATRFVAQIRRTGIGGADAVRVTLGRSSGTPNPATSVFANSPGGVNNTAFGPWVGITSALNAGNGSYDMAITRSAAASRGYEVSFHCERTTTAAGAAAPLGSGAETGTGIGVAGPDYVRIINR